MSLKRLIPKWMKPFLRLARRWAYRLTSKPKIKGFNTQITVLSDGSNPTFFGYHDKTPFSLDGTIVLAMSITSSDTKPESECTPMKLGYFQKNTNGEFENTFTPFAQTTTWCFQQGCMLQWHPMEPDRRVIFNVLVDGAYGSIVFDISKGEEVHNYPYPIYSLHPSGKLAATLNFSRLGRLRPGYGYGLLPDNTELDRAPAEDGLFVFDMEICERRLLVSLADLAKEAGNPSSQHYINHASFSPDGKQIVFFHLWTVAGEKKRWLRVCRVDLENGSWYEVESERIVSHLCWRDTSCFLATTYDKTGRWRYTLYDLKQGKRTDIDLPFNGDGHPMLHPLSKNIIVTDSYPDKRGEQFLYTADINTKTSKTMAALYSPLKYSGLVRCDLHPRWDREGKYIVVDSVNSNIRKMLLLSAE